MCACLSPTVSLLNTTQERTAAGNAAPRRPPRMLQNASPRSSDLREEKGDQTASLMGNERMNIFLAKSLKYTPLLHSEFSPVISFPYTFLI